MEILNVIEGKEITEHTICGIIAILALIIGLFLFAGGVFAGDGVLGVTGLVFILFATILYVLPVPLKKTTGEFEPNKYEVVLTDLDYVIDAMKYRIVEGKGKIIVLEEVK